MAAAAVSGMAEVSLLGVEDAVPNELPKGRYEEIMRHCPFALASVKARPEAPQPSFAVNWYVAGIARLGGDYYVTIKARDLSEQFSLFGDQPDGRNKVRLIGVNWSDNLGKSTVTIQKDKEMATLVFNEAEMQSTPTQLATPAGQTGKAGVPNATTATVTGRIPAAMTPPPVVAGMKGGVVAANRTAPKPHTPAANPAGRSLQIIVPPSGGGPNGQRVPVAKANYVPRGRPLPGSRFVPPAQSPR
jgi:hypothetical protein